MTGIGDNHPPTMIEVTNETTHSISEWLSENPVIQSEESAREAKVFLDRGNLCIKDLEDERDGKVRPLNTQVAAINDLYRSPRETLRGTIQILSQRITSFMVEERNKRIEAAREAARIAQEAELKAREAEQAKQDALGSAGSGELGIRIEAVVAEADNTFRDFERADRAAALAEKETKVKIGGGFSKAVSLRKKETVTVVALSAAISDLQTHGLVTHEILEAVRKAALAYRKVHGRLPYGVASKVTEGI